MASRKGMEEVTPCSRSANWAVMLAEITQEYAHDTICIEKALRGTRQSVEVAIKALMINEMMAAQAA